MGEAFVEVHADTRPFGREVRAEVRKLIRQAERTARRESERVGRSMSDGIADGIRRGAPGVDAALKKTIGKTKVKKEVEVDVDNDSLKKAGNVFSRFASGVADVLMGLGQQATKTFAAIGGGVASALANIGSAATNPYMLLIMAFLVALGGPAIVGGLAILGSVLWNLVGIIGLFPAVAVTATAAILPLVIAFQGFGEAISAILSRDPDKIKEALAGLAPAARSVALEFQKMLPFFDKLKEATQQAFFAQIQGQLTNLVKVLGPSVTNLLTTVATSLGQFAAQVAEKLANPRVAEFLDKVGAAVTSLVESLGPSLLGLFEAIGAMAEAALPLLVAIGEEFAEGIQKFADFIMQAIEDGRFQAWLMEAWLTLQQIWDIAKEFYDVLVTIFDEADTSGHEFLEIVKSALQKLSDFFKSPEGKDAILAMIGLAEAFAGALAIAAAVALGLLSVLGAVARAIAGILRDLGILSGKGGTIHTPGGGVSKGSGNAGSSIGTTQKRFAEGGIVDRPTVGLIGEAGKEVVIPLTNPSRAAELMEKSGLSDMMGPVNVTVFLGTKQITDILDMRVEQQLNAQSRALALGPREAA